MGRRQRKSGGQSQKLQKSAAQVQDKVKEVKRLRLSVGGARTQPGPRAKGKMHRDNSGHRAVAAG